MIQKKAFVCLCCLVGCYLFFHSGCVQKATEDEAAVQKQETPALALDPQAMDLLQQMSDFLKSHDEFEFVAEITQDEVLDSGQKLEFERRVEIKVRRPNKIKAEIEDVDGDKRFWYDGTKISLLGLRRKLYAQVDAPASIDETLDYLVDEYGLDMPLADFLVTESFESMTQFLRTAQYLGLENLRRRICHHLAFTQESIDWQIWIEDGETIVPRKFIITHKNAVSQPQYNAVFTEWNFSPKLVDRDFEFTAPEGSNKIEFIALRNESVEENK